MSGFLVHARASGKSDLSPEVKDIRAIMPLSARMILLDVILSQRILKFVDQVLPDDPAVFVAARPKTQPLDITFALSLAVERALDNFSRGGLAQADVEQYYDTIDVLAIAMWLVSRGFPLADAAAAARRQMLPRLANTVGATTTISIPARAVGSLTGSRTAGALARVPVEETMAAIRREAVPRGFPTGLESRLCYATFVDNVFAVSESMGGAVANIELFESTLQQRWMLRIKPSSRTCMAVEGCDQLVADPTRWKQSDRFVALGDTISADGSAWADVFATKRLLWRAFFANCCQASFRKAPTMLKLRCMQRAVSPILNYHNTRWPWSPRLAHYLDFPSAENDFDDCSLPPQSW